ncbi:tRNA (adenosine(37)-N6)-dimethylallyltransferase MiaA [Geomesophilobacter sediminis]|uniref:tRNA dimethylallyltransferase n=1 Tax=Geomesophilobacter sediminis TaxID=2798584 RepID=A0A8J7M1I5_9BACT|nr:tRNA (adenosine(37)-N6)-dimethylallyltransferase MiaA [Geomesophilobacter sediminis]MBJ6726965.1 tRNA (adenosine(37)-N6)-dimethylallyltransferase MiaA [Geomesophilobacter sediminis]
MIEARIKLVVIGGPTGSGKSGLAVRLAEEIGAEIVNADSMQVYRYLDIGTAKPTREELDRVPHHLIGFVSPEVNFTASDFRREAAAVIEDIVARGKKVIVVGGTGLYLRALVEGLVDSPKADETLRRELEALSGEELVCRLAEVDPESASRLHRNDRVRLVRALEVYHQTGRPVSALRTEHGFSGEHYDTLKIAIKVEREALYRRLDQRVDTMLESGLEQEVRSLLSRGFSRELKSMRSIGYKEMCAYIAGEMGLEEATRLMKRDTRHYAKRQLTWFKRDNEIYWLEYPESFATIHQHVIEFFA